MLRSWIVWGVLLCLLAGCAPTNDVVTHGPFQKRKYRPGWHIDLARKAPATRGPERMERADAVDSLQTRQPTHPVSPGLPRMASPSEASPPLASTERSMVPGPKDDHVLAPIPDTVPNGTGTDALPEHRYFNRMAIISGLFLAVAGIVFAISGATGLFTYLMVFAFITGVIGLLLAIKHDEKGKLIALTAIVVSLALLAVAIFNPEAL